jgi:hypothetical protein
MLQNPVGLDSSVGIATSYGVDGPGIKSRWGARFSALVQTGPGAYLASCTMVGTGSFPGVRSGRGVTQTPHPPLLVLWSWKNRAVPLLPPWAVRPAQSLNACTRVHFTFTFQNPVCVSPPVNFRGIWSRRTESAINSKAVLTFIDVWMYILRSARDVRLLLCLCLKMR